MRTLKNYIVDPKTCFSFIINCVAKSSASKLQKLFTTKYKLLIAAIDPTLKICFLPLTKQVNMPQNSNGGNSAWPWNYACLTLTPETQLNSSVLKQSRTAWMNMHFDWECGNHNPLSPAVWQPPAVQHLTSGSLQSFFFFFFSWWITTWVLLNKMSETLLRVEKPASLSGL